MSFPDSENSMLKIILNFKFMKFFRIFSPHSIVSFQYLNLKRKVSDIYFSNYQSVAELHHSVLGYFSCMFRLHEWLFEFLDISPVCFDYMYDYLVVFPYHFSCVTCIYYGIFQTDKDLKPPDPSSSFRIRKHPFTQHWYGFFSLIIAIVAPQFLFQN